MKKNLLYICFVLLGFHAVGQHTVGLLSYDPAKAFDGYNLIYPHNQSKVFLFDNCGEVVHTWTAAANTRPGNTAYLLPDGRLVRAIRPAAVGSDPIWAGGGGATVEILDWESNVEWSFTLNDSLYRLHHDIAVMPNGHILMIVWEAKSYDQAVQAGRNPALLPNNKLWPDRIIEVDPANSDIVWEWRVWDHLVQDFDPTKDNYGVVAGHPELVDINFDTSNGAPSWLHTNAIDFNVALNQILLSVPTFNEVWIIDHSTTTAEAASHSGGLGASGGDLLYRWGNPQAYQSGTAADQRLFFQHNPHWIGEFLEPTHPHYDKIAVFNNRAGADFSTVNVFAPGWDMYDWRYLMSDGKFLPTNHDVTMTHPDPQAAFSTGLSSVQLLPNGNTLVLSGRQGYMFELSPDGDIVWEYITPLKAGQPVSQGDTILIEENQTFRLKRYPADYPGFEGKDLSPKGWIELGPDSTFCDELLPVETEMASYQLKIYPNPATDRATIEWAAGRYVEVEVLDLLGRPVLPRMRLTGGRKFLDVSGWLPGLYFVRVGGREVQRLVVR